LAVTKQYVACGGLHKIPFNDELVKNRGCTQIDTLV